MFTFALRVNTTRFRLDIFEFTTFMDFHFETKDDLLVERY